MVLPQITRAQGKSMNPILASFFMSVIKHHDQSNLSKADFGFVVLEDESHHPSLSQWGSTAAGTYSSHLKQEAKKKWNQNDLNPALSK